MNSEFTRYYAVIFTSIQTEGDNGYHDLSLLMEHLAKKQEGYLGLESARNEVGISISYWKDLEAIKNWKGQTDHMIAQKKGRKDWYSRYKVCICKGERDYELRC